MFHTVLNLIQTHPYLAGLAGLIGVMFLRKIIFVLVIVCVLGYLGMHYGK